MSRIYIPVEESAKEWMKNADFSAAYDALEGEFAVAVDLTGSLNSPLPSVRIAAGVETG